ncbi:hypothetical protein PspLS_02346 [Pyricularia sp. CBS 133598]|nr:hypothetical protein PspLS_02346 [Pyricularia sp. CBS 133598]
MWCGGCCYRSRPAAGAVCAVWGICDKLPSLEDDPQPVGSRFSLGADRRALHKTNLEADTAKQRPFDMS